MLSKELRECGLYAGLALLAMIHYIGAGMDLPLIPFLNSDRQGEIPFIGGRYDLDREGTFVLIGVLAGVVLGLHQTVWESWRQTTLFLLHRPMPRAKIILSKILAGSLMILLITAGPLLIYSAWAAAPGTHASPFFWGMTETWWRGVEVAFVCYLGAFLAGIRPAAWLGSRTWPAISTIVMAVGLKFAPVWPVFIYFGLTTIAVILVALILDTARLREFP